MRRALIVRVFVVVAAAISAAMAPVISTAQVGPAYSIEMSRMTPMRAGPVVHR